MIQEKYYIGDLNKEDKAFFIEMLPYVSEDIVKFSVEDEQNICIWFEIAKRNTVIEKIEKLKEMVTLQLTRDSAEQMKTIVLEDYSQRQPVCKDNMFAQMVDREMISEIAPGAFAYNGLFLKVYEYFIKKIDTFCEEKYGKNVKTYYMPALMPISEYERGGYFDSFPHHIMFQTSLVDDIEVIDKFSKHGMKEPSILEETKLPCNVLRTAACAPLYPLMAGKRIDEETVKVFAVSGKCYRNESSNVHELSRLNEFFMKEYVFMGTEEQIHASIEIAKELWKEWSSVFNLCCKIVTANDSFFASNYKKLKLFQMLGNSKVEFKIQIPYSKEFIACSSANYHRTHFTKKYKICKKNGNSLCVSGCFAFGVERLTYALLSQKGIDIEKWDSNTREEIEKYVKLD
ncbi:hypothetical protein H6A65_00830 [Mediterraneibacter glycyrrhizinilyticus]|uniref:aminoacyl--tRNA ligase-related protein n=1 Tax=Mediterraneibacter glycyrrhizinilyticus TaxID=342942 RepID=UPI0019609D9A|nr:aminoacyl--tRNA ligase-related protein [Mediterraneibacter glycyrrhizinilyticus]MBM6750048.1 hypothetical protein [Mediterraneibacter glycyrrhizinilyticus]